MRHHARSAINALMPFSNGVLSATTAFGKTVTAAALIARRKTNTLILVDVYKRQVIISQYLQERTCATVGRNDKHSHRRFSWHGHSTIFLAFDVSVHCFFVLLLQSFGKFMQIAIDRCYKFPA